MYALMSLYRIGIENRKIAMQMADQANPIFENMKGFVTSIYLGDDTIGEYIALTVWNSKEDAEAARAAIGPRMDQAVVNIGKVPATRRLLEVYEPQP